MSRVSCRSFVGAWQSASASDLRLSSTQNSFLSKAHEHKIKIYSELRNRQLGFMVTPQRARVLTLESALGPTRFLVIRCSNAHMFYSGNARGWVAVLLASTFGVSEIHAALLGLYPFSSDTTAVSLGANVSGFSVFNDNSAGGVTGGVNTTAPGFYHTSTSWNTTFNRYVQFTVTPSSGSYIIPENVVMSVRQNDANSATMMKVEVFFGTTFLDSGTATLSPGQSGGGPFSTLTFNFNAANFTAAFAGPLAFRIEAMVNDGGNNYLDFDSVSLNGIVVPENANSALVIFGLMFGTARLLRLKVARKRSQKNLRIFRAFELS